MRRTSFVIAAFSLVALGSAAHAEEHMKMGAPAKPAPTATQPKPSQQHQQGMQHGGQQMHDQMMKNQAAGMAMKDSNDPSSQAGMKKGCSDASGCMGMKMPGMQSEKPADPPMPMKGHM